MNIKFVVVMYMLIPTMLAFLTYATLLDLVGDTLALIGGICIATLFFISFCNTVGKPISFPKTCPHGFEDWDDCPDCCH